MQAIRNKLNTQKGASITFALLLFLVCAVISSVVIVAATTAAGRMSQLPQMDQRYYAVTSAARLLQSEIDGKKINVEYDKNKSESEKKTTVKSITEKDEIIWPKGDEENTHTIIADVSENLVNAIKTGSGSSSDIVERKWNVTVKTAGAADNTVDYLSCNIKANLKSNGLLVFTIVDGTDEINGKYKLELTFSSNVRERASDSNSAVSDTSVEWNFLSLHKIRSTTAGGGGV